jgi:hypothetical protein
LNVSTNLDGKELNIEPTSSSLLPFPARKVIGVDGIMSETRLNLREGQ